MRDATVKYAAEFEHDGAQWALNLFANDLADVRKLESLKSCAVLLGEVVETIPYANASGIDARSLSPDLFEEIFLLTGVCQ